MLRAHDAPNVRAPHDYYCVLDAGEPDAPFARESLFAVPEGDFIVFTPFEEDVVPFGPPVFGALMPAPP